MELLKVGRIHCERCHCNDRTYDETPCKKCQYNPQNWKELFRIKLNELKKTREVSLFEMHELFNRAKAKQRK